MTYIENWRTATWGLPPNKYHRRHRNRSHHRDRNRRRHQHHHEQQQQQHTIIPVMSSTIDYSTAPAGGAKIKMSSTQRRRSRFTIMQRYR
jgi:hypothetical protein